MQQCNRYFIERELMDNIFIIVSITVLISPDRLDVEISLLQHKTLELPHPTTHAKVISLPGDESKQIFKLSSCLHKNKERCSRYSHNAVDLQSLLQNLL